MWILNSVWLWNYHTHINSLLWKGLWMLNSVWLWNYPHTSTVNLERFVDVKLSLVVKLSTHINKRKDTKVSEHMGTSAEVHQTHNPLGYH